MINAWQDSWRLPSGKTLKNRIVLAPLTNKQSLPTGELGEDEWLFLQRRAEGGFGMLISAAAHVMPSAQAFSGQLGVFSDRHLPGLKRLAALEREYDCALIIQLFHGGVRCPEALTGQKPRSASNIAVSSEYPEGAQALTIPEIEEIIQSFSDAAFRVFQAGLAGIEIHGAHGYLINQFLDKSINKRQDQYGGNAAARRQFLLAIVQAIRSRIPAPFIVGVRLSPLPYQGSQDWSLDESLETALALHRLGIDYLHLSLGDYKKQLSWQGLPEQRLLTCFRQASLSTLPLIAAGGILNQEDAEQAISWGADALAIGKRAIAFSDWPRRSQNQPSTMSPPPYTREQLAKEGLGPVFVEYMKRWPGFVSE